MLLKWTLLKPVAPDYTGARGTHGDYCLIVHSYPPKARQAVKRWVWDAMWCEERVAQSPLDKPFPSRKAAIAGAEAWWRNQEAIRA